MVADILYELIIDTAINKEIKYLQLFFDFLNTNHLLDTNSTINFSKTHDEIFKDMFEIFVLNIDVNKDLKLLDTWLNIMANE